MKVQKIVSSWLEVSRSALEHNILLYKSVIGSAKLAVIVKSNAYGCGLDLIANLLDQNEAIDCLCVASLAEAVYLRELGVAKNILVLGIVDCDLKQVLINNIEIAVYNLQTILELNQLGKAYNQKVKIHLKIDTGMSRLGFFADQLLDLIQDVLALEFITIEGIFTHFAASDSANLSFLDQQTSRFSQLLLDLDLKKVIIKTKHAANTAAITLNNLNHLNMVRVGIGLYGMWPSDQNKHVTQSRYPQFNLKMPVTWKTRIISVKELPIGNYVGYSLTYQTTKVTKIATIAVGYYDGYDSRLSNRGQVLINNQLVPIIGSISMNMAMVDVTGLDTQVGAEVTLLADIAGIHPDDLANICNISNTEIVARINPLITRKLVF